MDVAEGEICFVIEQPPYEASVLSAEGRRRAGRSGGGAGPTGLRAERAARGRAISAQELDQYAADLQSAEGQLLAARADLVQAEIDLSYTEVRAPFADESASRFVDVGNLVGADGDPRSRQHRPARSHAGRLRTGGSQVADFLAVWPKNEISVSITLPESAGTRTYEGTLDLVNNVAGKLDLDLRRPAEFPNTDLRVVPGLAADVVVDLGLRKDQIVVPEVAIQVDPQSVYVWTVTAGKLSANAGEGGDAVEGLRS